MSAAARLPQTRKSRTTAAQTSGRSSSNALPEPATTRSDAPSRRASSNPSLPPLRTSTGHAGRGSVGRPGKHEPPNEAGLPRVRAEGRPLRRPRNRRRRPRRPPRERRGRPADRRLPPERRPPSRGPAGRGAAAAGPARRAARAARSSRRSRAGAAEAHPRRQRSSGAEHRATRGPARRPRLDNPWHSSSGSIIVQGSERFADRTGCMKLPVLCPKELENPSPPAFDAAGFFVRRNGAKGGAACRTT